MQEQERKERRQRYYSYNQDVDGGGGVPVKPDLIATDRTSPGGGNNKANSVKTRNLPSQRDQLDSCDLLLGFGQPPAASPLIADGITEINSKHAGPNVFLTGSCAVIASDVVRGSVSALEIGNVQEPLLPPHVDLNIIPEEKDTTYAKQSFATPSNLASDSLQGGSIDIPHAQHLIQSSPGTDSCDGEKRMSSGTNASSSQTSNCIDTNLCLQMNTNHNNNNNVNEKSIVAESRTLVSTDASPADMLNHIYHHANNFNNESNNSSINNVNYINNNVMCNGMVRNNSGNHFVRNNNSVSSFTSTTMMPNSNSATAPNGIPTIIIPSAQQSKQSSNAKLEIMNNAR